MALIENLSLDDLLGVKLFFVPQDTRVILKSLNIICVISVVRIIFMHVF